MVDALPYAALSAAVITLWFCCLLRLDVLTPQDLRAWRHVAKLRGYAQPGGRLEGFARRTPWLHRLQEELDLDRLLAVAGRDQTPLGFLGFTLLAALASAGALVVADVAQRSATGEWFGGIAPWSALLALPLTPVILILSLRHAARRRRQRADRALGDMMMLVAIMTDGRGLQLEDAVRILARCVTNDALSTLVSDQGWTRLVPGGHGSTIELYRRIAEEYHIPAFATVADAAANANLGFSERETYTAVARGVYARRLSEARVQAARAKTLVTLPVAGMLVPLLLLLGAPALGTISGGLGGG